MKKSYGFLIALLVALGFTSSPAKADTESVIRKITQETPLVLRHAESIFGQIEGVDTNYHQSHRSHYSHKSHFSHFSSR